MHDLRMHIASGGACDILNITFQYLLRMNNCKPKPFTIQMHYLSGDPSGLMIIRRLADWAAVCYAFRRSMLEDSFPEDLPDKPGVYLLWAETTPTTAYVGKSDEVWTRVRQQLKKKTFWTRGFVASTSQGEPDLSHLGWLESTLIRRMKETSTATVNSQVPKLPPLSKEQKNTSAIHLERILQVLPLAGFMEFEPVDDEQVDEEARDDGKDEKCYDTIIVPTGNEGNFNHMFISQNYWCCVNISEKKKRGLKYILAYQPAPVSKITMIADIEGIEDSSDFTGKSKIIFKGPATKLQYLIPFSNAKRGTMQGHKYTCYDKLKNAKQLSDLL